MTARLKNIPCPHCRKPTAWRDNPHRPFCSERCRLADLGHWAEESYKIPVGASGQLLHGDEKVIDLEAIKDRRTKGDE